MKAGISVGETTKAKDFIKTIVKNSKLLLKTNVDGTFDIDTLKSEYTPEDVDKVIDSSDVIHYIAFNTPLKEIYDEILVEFDMKYEKKVFAKNTGIITAEESQGGGQRNRSGTGNPLFPLNLERMLEPSEYFYNSSSDPVVGMSTMTENMYQPFSDDGSAEDFLYKRSFYNLPDTANSLVFKSETIRTFDSAYEMQKMLTLWYCNQHLIMDVTLPVKYSDIEVGDIVSFDELINNKRIHNFDYTQSYVKNGQVIYPYFLVTDTHKTMKDIKIIAIQLHKLTWGIDGHTAQSFNLGWPDDYQTYNWQGNAITEGFQQIVNPAVTWKNGDSQLPGQAYAETLELNISGVFATLDETSIQFLNVGENDISADSVFIGSYIESSSSSGEHKIGVQAIISNGSTDNLREAKIELEFLDVEWNVSDDNLDSNENHFSQVWIGEEDDDGDDEARIEQVIYRA